MFESIYGGQQLAIDEMNVAGGRVNPVQQLPLFDTVDELQYGGKVVTGGAQFEVQTKKDKNIFQSKSTTSCKAGNNQVCLEICFSWNT